MNELERELNYPLGEALPEPGATLALPAALTGQRNSGVRWVRMALPFALDHINLWLLRDRIDGQDGWSVVDCCIARDESKAQWEQIFASSLDGLPVLRVIVTHMHPDHIGLAHWLCERWRTPQRDCPLLISATDYHLARIGSADVKGFGGESAADFYAVHGLTDPVSIEKIRQRAGYYHSLVPDVPSRFQRLMDGDVLTIGDHAWKCISGYGHAPEHISLYCAELDLLIGGDMMLPRISTNVSVFEMEPEADPLRLFLASIDKFKALPPQTLTLPSHGKPFTGLHQRIAQLHAHHQARLAEVLDACSTKPCSAADILPVLFKRQLDLHQTTFAMGESIAHLHALWFDGRVHRSRDSQGIYRFSAR